MSIDELRVLRHAQCLREAPDTVCFLFLLAYGNCAIILLLIVLDWCIASAGTILASITGVARALIETPTSIRRE